MHGMCQLHKNSLRIHLPTARTSVTRKSRFRIICVIISGLVPQECQKPQPPLLLQKYQIHLQFVQCLSQYFRCPYVLRKGKYCQYSSHLYHSTPPICIAIRLPFALQRFWENLGGCGHQDVPHESTRKMAISKVNPLEMAMFPVSPRKNHMSQEEENRGSPVDVP